MITTTTSNLEGRKVTAYLGVVAAEAIVNTLFVRELFSAVTRVMGERTTETPETKVAAARETALRLLEERAVALGADAVIDLRLRYSHSTEWMLIVSATGTAVKIE